MYHDLNSTQDTLVLQCPELIRRVYTIGDSAGLIDYQVDKNEFNVPLNKLEKGRHVFVVDRTRHKIVFQIEILQTRRITAHTELTNMSIVAVEPAKLTYEPEPDLVVSIDTKEPILKPYNITEKNRGNIQAREEAMRLIKEKREKELIEIERKQRDHRYEGNSMKTREDAIRLIKERRQKELVEVQRKQRAFRYEGSKVQSREDAVRLAKEKRQKELVEVERKRKAYRKNQE